jgi:hypothetical protein
MHTVSVQIMRFSNPSFPGWVECVLRDASGREWLFSDKVPVFTESHLDAGSTYPQPGVVACEIVREWTDEDGRTRCQITTDRPRSVEAVGGETEFEIFREQITS